ncbi:hypothetical protein HK102_000830, partial [Quaeritorhiza haematococci]
MKHFSSPLKRRRDIGEFPLPDAKSQRISSALSSRLARSLRVCDSTFELGGSVVEEEKDVSKDEEAMLEDVTNSGDMDVSTTNIASPTPRIIVPTKSIRKKLSKQIVGSGSGLFGRSPPSGPFSGENEHERLMQSSVRFEGAALMSQSAPSTSPTGTSAELQPSLETAPILEMQAQRRGIATDVYVRAWNDRRRELEHNLTLLQNGVPSDSYDDIRAITEKIIEAAEWLSCGERAELGALIPLWRMLERNIENVVNYIKIVEDMKATVNCSFHMFGDLDVDLKRMKELLQTKNDSYRDVLRQNAAQWILLGFPVESELIQSVKNWFYGLPRLYFTHLEQELYRPREVAAFHDLRIPHLMENALSGIQFTTECSHFLHAPVPPRLMDQVLSLGAIFINYTTSMVDNLMNRSGKTRSAEGRVIMLYENLIQLFQHLRILQDTMEIVVVPSKKGMGMEGFSTMGGRFYSKGDGRL